jgi:orotidine-5'-phosphate decarboxylase
MSKILARDRLIVALDLDDIQAAQAIVEELEGVVNFFKIGLALQLAPGVENFIVSLINQGKRVFLDYKYYDVEETVRRAVVNAAKLGVSFLTIHGSRNLMTAAVQGRGSSNLKLLIVTVLTSMDADDIKEMGYEGQTVENLVLFRAKKALQAGCDGVIASGQEAAAIKQLSGGNLLVVSPGIRPDGYPEDDQKRRVTPAQAIKAGADYLVIGRPITDDANHTKMAQEFLAEMQRAFDDAGRNAEVYQSR